MATKIIEPAKPAKIQVICDLCDTACEKYIKIGQNVKKSVTIGRFQTQSDAWDIDFLATFDVSKPYCKVEDVCEKCLRESIDKLLKEHLQANE